MTGSARYFALPVSCTVAGLVLAGWLGHRFGGMAGAAEFLFVGTVLAALEISLSFDNAIVNANKLKSMSPVWQRRFLTWGILIAVFGMRIVFPLAVVAVAGRMGPWHAVELAAMEPEAYARIMEDAHLGISAYGGAFLMMVALHYFVDAEKDVDWFGAVECRMRRCAGLRGGTAALVVAILAAFAVALPGDDGPTFFAAGIGGLLTFLAVELLGRALDRADAARGVAQGGLGAFLYLEVLDASFSFDGVIGAFALTQNLFLIAIGLGIGAFYVRAMTVMLVEKGTLAEFRYLEHGAFWSILALSVIMFGQSLWHVPEVVTGSIGVGLIGLALMSSIRVRRQGG